MLCGKIGIGFVEEIAEVFGICSRLFGEGIKERQIFTIAMKIRPCLSLVNKKG